MANLIQTDDRKDLLERVVVVSECLIWTLREKVFLYTRLREFTEFRQQSAI